MKYKKSKSRISVVIKQPEVAVYKSRFFKNEWEKERRKLLK